MNTTQILSNEQLRKAAPSIFAEQPWEQVSEKYKFIPTITVLDELRKEGFLPVKAVQSKTRIEGKGDFTKHLIRFRHQDYLDKPAVVGDSIPEIVLVNSHDRSSSYELLSGLYRLACSNGLLVKTSDFESIRVTHSGNVVDNVIEGSCRLIADVPKLIDKVQTLQGIQLTNDQRSVFAKAALQLKYDTDESGNVLSPVSTDRILAPRRSFDSGKDLWTTFNVVQENLIKGGLRGTSDAGKRTRTRGVTSVSGDVRLNKALWTLTDEIAKLVTQ